MSILDDLLFTDLDLNLSEFVERFRSQFPVILITRIGIDPSDDPLYCVSAEEVGRLVNKVYWITGIQRQKRVVAADIKYDDDRRYFSIPFDYHRKFQLIGTKGREEILGPPVPMRKIVEEMNLPAGPKNFVLANSNNIRVNFEGSKSRSAQIGTLKFIDEYNQKYLVGHTLYRNVMDMTPRSIPVYLDITVDVATGFKGHNEATFTEWMRLVKGLGQCNQRTRVKTCDEIIQFKEMPECGQYDYIRSFNYLKTQDTTRHKEPEITDISPPTNNSTRRSISSENDEHNSAAPPIPERTYGAIPHSHDIIQFRELPECGKYDSTQDTTRHQDPESIDTSSPTINGTPRLNSSEETGESDEDNGPAPPIPERTYETKRLPPSDEDNSAAPPIPERTYGTKRLPPIPRNIPDTQTVVGKRPRPAAIPHAVDVEYDYAECRSEADADYEIVPYAESRHSLISEFQKSLTRRNTKHKASEISQANPYTECRPTPEAFKMREDGLVTTVDYDSDYETFPHLETKTILSEPHLLKRVSVTNSVDSSTTSEKSGSISSEAMPIGTSSISDKLAGIYGEALSVNTSLISEKVGAVYTVRRLPSPKQLSTDDGKARVDADRPFPTQTPLLQLNHISEVPKGLDLSSLSVAEFAHCLNLLGLSKYSDVFRQNDVDGKLASELSIETLERSFNFSNFEAMKFTKFIKGWRPVVK